MAKKRKREGERQEGICVRTFLYFAPCPAINRSPLSIATIIGYNSNTGKKPYSKAGSSRVGRYAKCRQLSQRFSAKFPFVTLNGSLSRERFLISGGRLTATDVS